MNIFAIIVSIVCLLSLIVNVILVMYIRKTLLRVFVASEEASVIFTQLDTYREHLISVYETPTFYGDETLTALLNHTHEVFDTLKKYEEVYSFTQPDLIHQLELASLELEEEYEREAKEKE